MSKSFYASLAIVALILLLLWMLGLIGGEKVAPGQTEVSAEQRKTANTARVQQRAVKDVLSWAGTVKARTEAQIAPRITARIVAIKVRAGDKVKKGDLIAQLDPEAIRAKQREAAATLAALKAEAARARADEQRIRNLYTKEAATKEHFDQAVAQSRAAQARMQAAGSALQEVGVNVSETELRAPFDGVIVTRLQEPGDMALTGVPIVTMHRAKALRMEAAIATHCATRISIGSPAKLRIETLDKPLTAEIDEIVPEVDPQTRTVLMKATLPELPELQPGLFGWLEQACGEHQALLIPARAVRRIGQLEIVTVLTAGKQLIRHVRTAKAQDGLVEIQSGLNAGETVLLP
ncbi:MAG: efflux RND transporter periplasmic adaptor subunit [Gammaproteobacteria bacterium]